MGNKMAMRTAEKKSTTDTTRGAFSEMENSQPATRGASIPARRERAEAVCVRDAEAVCQRMQTLEPRHATLRTPLAVPLSSVLKTSGVYP